VNEHTSTIDGVRLPRSLYVETACERTPTTALRGDKSVAVVVIGAGFTGLSAALHLVQAGVEVTVLEANEPGWGASGRNGGQVNPGLKHEPEEIERQFGQELGQRMVALSGNAPSRVFQIVREHQIRCEANQGGTIRAAFTAKSSDFLRRATGGLRSRGAPVELLEGDALIRATGTDRYVCAALDRRGGSVNPLGYARGLAEAAIRAGAAIHSNTKATAISRKGSQWTVTTPGGVVTGRWLVLATNGYTDNLWPKLRQTIVPVYSGIVATEPLLQSVARRILPQGSVLYEHEDITVYYRLDTSNRLLMGGRSRQSPMEGTEGLEGLKVYTKRLFPFIGDVRWSHGWNGQLAITTDHYPHFSEPAQNVIVCMGYNGRGVAMATAMGGEIAKRIKGHPPNELDMPVRPMHPIRFHRFWPLAVNARIAYGRLRTALQR
jgi:glycine/D-amino acid oxidase-like deaminating enzyme